MKFSWPTFLHIILCGLYSFPEHFFVVVESYWNCVEKRWSKKRLMGVRVKACVPATVHSWPILRPGLLLLGLTGTLHHSKMKPHPIKVTTETFHLWQRTPNPLRCKLYVYSSILSNGNTDDAVSSYQPAQNGTIFHPFYIAYWKGVFALQNCPWYSPSD